MVLKVKIKGLKRIQRKLKRLEPRVYRPALAAAMNRAIGGAQTKGARKINKEMGGPKISEIKRDMKKHRATKQRLRAVLEARGQPLSLDAFRAKARNKGVSHTAYGKGRRLLQGSFMATGRRSGRRGVFIRRTEKRYPIKRLYGPGIARTMASKEVMDEMFIAINGILMPRLRHEIQRRMARFK